MNIIKNKITLMIAIVGTVGGIIWSFKSDFDMEPIILTIISIIEITGYFLCKDAVKDSTDNNDYSSQIIHNEKNISKQININKNEGTINM